MVIAHNLAAMNTKRMLNINDNKKAVSTQRLSSGYKINRAADDAAGLSISEKMRHQIRGLNQGAQNIQEGVGYCQVADGALEEIQDMLHRITELSVKASNGTLSTEDRSVVNEEIQSLKSEMSKICSSTKFNEEYIFKSGKSTEEPYDLEFSGILKDIYVYNDSFDATGATYGGIAYEGTRYAWDSIDPNMYDAATNTFNEGNYTLKAADGSYVTLVCEDGNNPPQISREFTTKADENGIYINDEFISWNKVKTANGTKFDPNNILIEPYSFEYGGIKTSFTPGELDTFEDVIDRLSDIKLTSTYNAPTEETAVFADFSKNTLSFSSDAEVEHFLENYNTSLLKYKISADENGLSLKDENGNEVADSTKTWTELGLNNWGNGSTDIWSDKTYTYKYQATNGNEVNFSFSLVNETSKDSVIDALDGVELKTAISPLMDNSPTISTNGNVNIKGVKITRDSLSLTLKEEYELGRDYAVTSDEIASQAVNYDSTNKKFSVTYTGVKDIDADGNPTTKIYANTESATNSIVNTVKNQINSNLNGYINLITQRYLAGAENPTDIDMASVIGNDKVTGNGANVNFKEAYEFKQSDMVDNDATDGVDTIILKSTLDFKGTDQYAGVKIDFSGLGTDYKMADLIGIGFNSTCETCSNHYSIQFAIPEATDTSWSKIQIDGNDYNYKYEQKSSHHTLYIDAQSMMDNGVDDGVDLTNKLVDILNGATHNGNETQITKHYTQYASYINGTELYIFDNRTSYVDNQTGQSTATQAEFEPYAYTMNSVANFSMYLYDKENSAESVTINFQYDWKDLLKPENLQITAVEDANGLYVKNASDQYELYDATKHIDPTVKRYNITNVSLDTGSDTQDQHIEKYIRETIFKEISDSTQMQLVGNSAKYSINGKANQNAAMITAFSEPVQVGKENAAAGEADEFLRIQCSSNVIDNIQIKKQKLSLSRMGISNLNTLTQEDANKAIEQIDFALNKVSSIRSTFGAYQNRLEHSYATNGNVAENTTYAESKIRDTDMALEMVRFSNTNILAQAGQAMLAQANQINQGVLSLLS